MLRIFSLFVLLTFSSFSLVYAVESDPSVELSIRNVKVLDDMNVRVAFSEDIDISSLVLKITRQSDNSSISLSDIVIVADAPEAVDVKLEEALTEGTSYTLTVLAAISVEGATIVDGAQALREFVTPSPLKKAEPTLSAPPNPTAVTVKDPDPTPAPKETLPKPVKKQEPTPTEELPLTGINSLLFLLIALPIAYIFMRRKPS